MARPNLLPLRVLPIRVAPRSASDRATVEIYRPFFTAGIVTVLTVGCLLGAIALFGISGSKSYTASAWTPTILAHANSQLFGWVGFFVIGFALQQHAPSLAKAKAFHRLAWGSLGFMAIGIALRFFAEPMAASGAPLGVPLGVVACLAQLLAVVLFLFNTSYTRHRPTPREPLTWPSLFVFASLFWLFAISVAEPFVFMGAHQADRMQSIQFVAEWFSPLREAQFLGFVAMMIFGVSLTKFSSCFGAKPADKTLGIVGFMCWMVGLLMRMVGWVWAFRHGMEGTSQVPYFMGGVFFAAGAGYLLFATRLFGVLKEALRSHKFLRAAYGWLLVAGILFIVEPLHLRAIGQPFSHAYTGAIRHALTVGFISQMIIGIGSHVIARMNDLEDVLLPRLWPTFILLNVGNALRVACEIGTDYTPRVFPLMGITGFIELCGLLLWGASMVRTMYSRKVNFQGATQSAG